MWTPVPVAFNASLISVPGGLLNLQCVLAGDAFYLLVDGTVDVIKEVTGSDVHRQLARRGMDVILSVRGMVVCRARNAGKLMIKVPTLSSSSWHHAGFCRHDRSVTRELSADARDGLAIGLVSLSLPVYPLPLFGTRQGSLSVGVSIPAQWWARN